MIVVRYSNIILPVQAVLFTKRLNEFRGIFNFSESSLLLRTGSNASLTRVYFKLYFFIKISYRAIAAKFRWSNLGNNSLDKHEVSKAIGV